MRDYIDLNDAIQTIGRTMTNEIGYNEFECRIQRLIGLRLTGAVVAEVKEALLSFLSNLTGSSSKQPYIRRLIASLQ